MNLDDVHLYDKVLRLRHVHLSGWQRECLTWGSFLLAVLLALTGLVSPWGIVVLPAALAVVVKGHDLLIGRLPTAAERLVPSDLPGIRSGPAASRPDVTRNNNEPPVTRTGGS